MQACALGRSRLVRSVQSCGNPVDINYSTTASGPLRARTIDCTLWPSVPGQTSDHRPHCDRTLVPEFITCARGYWPMIPSARRKPVNQPASCITSRRILHTPSIPCHRLALRIQISCRCAQRREGSLPDVCVIFIRVRTTHTRRWARRAPQSRDRRAFSQESYATFGSIISRSEKTERLPKLGLKVHVVSEYRYANNTLMSNQPQFFKPNRHRSNRHVELFA